jgi:hypothetical protein
MAPSTQIIIGLFVVLGEIMLIVVIILWKLRDQWEALDRDLDMVEETDESSL